MVKYKKILHILYNIADNRIESFYESEPIRREITMKQTTRDQFMTQYIKKWIALLLVSVLMMTSIQLWEEPITIAHAEEAEIVSINASYSGPAVILGKEIDPSKLTVTATYNDGVTNEITNYTIVSKTVTQEGSNQFMVIYEGKTANFYVTGKKLLSIYAYYAGPLISIGNSVDRNDVKVLASFSDGSTDSLTDFVLQTKVITNVGKNTLYLTSEGKVMQIDVYGTEPKEITALYATYSGGSVTVGNRIDPSNLTITAAYKDGSSEKINNYTLTPEVIGATGTQVVVASYHGKTVSFNVVGANKELKSITARYIGDAIGVGYSVNPIDVDVTGTYNDGSTAKIKQFNLLSATITYVGYQIVTVEVGGLKAEIIVQGVAEHKMDFSNASNFTISNGTNKATVSVSIPKNIDKTSIKGTSIGNATVTRLLTRAIRKSTFIAFEIEATNEDVIDQFPLTVKITVPNEFKLTDTALYFTPNKKSIIGKMNTASVAPNIIVVTIFHPGTYILSYKPS